VLSSNERSPPGTYRGREVLSDRRTETIFDIPFAIYLLLSYLPCLSYAISAVPLALHRYLQFGGDVLGKVGLDVDVV
jgi:hypothetical protein